MKSVLTIKDKILLSPFWLISLLPLRVLYLLSDFIFLLIFHVSKYRRNVTMENLRNSFPSKNENELRSIERKFYRHLCDSFIESIYTINLNPKECNRRFLYRNGEIINKMHGEGRNIMLCASHYGNWEWAINYAVQFPYKMYGIYKPLTNHIFDRLFIYMRSKYNGVPVRMKSILRAIVESKNKGEAFSVYSLGDQRPGLEDLENWTMFLNQDTPMITGFAKVAAKFDLPVVFLNLDKTKRGYYEVTFQLISEHPKDEDPLKIVREYFHMLEKRINTKPEYWLWSHKRWKYQHTEGGDKS